MSDRIAAANKNRRQILIIPAVIGNTLEYIEFTTFIFLAPVIADIFFPKQVPTLAIIFTYLTIVITYLFRPIGGMIFGSIGDRYGRKLVFSFTLLLMAIPSFIIGILPTFAQISYFAPILLVLMRILQGCSMGGEVPGSITYVVEKFRQENYFFYCAILTCGANIGIVIGSQIISLLSQSTSHSFIYSIGWRILFLSGSILAVIGFYVRSSISESDEFINLTITKQINKEPFLVLIKNYSPEIISGIMLCTVVSLITSIFHIFLPSLLVTHYSFKFNRCN